MCQGLLTGVRGFTLPGLPQATDNSTNGCDMRLGPADAPTEVAGASLCPRHAERKSCETKVLARVFGEGLENLERRELRTLSGSTEPEDQSC